MKGKIKRGQGSVRTSGPEGGRFVIVDNTGAPSMVPAPWRGRICTGYEGVAYTSEVENNTMLVWCGAESYVSGLQDAAASCKPDT